MVYKLLTWLPGVCHDVCLRPRDAPLGLCLLRCFKKRPFVSSRSSWWHTEKNSISEPRKNARTKTLTKYARACHILKVYRGNSLASQKSGLLHLLFVASSHHYSPPPPPLCQCVPLTSFFIAFHRFFGRARDVVLSTKRRQRKSVCFDVKVDAALVRRIGLL